MEIINFLQTDWFDKLSEIRIQLTMLINFED